MRAIGFAILLLAAVGVAEAHTLSNEEKCDRSKAAATASLDAEIAASPAPQVRAAKLTDRGEALERMYEAAERGGKSPVELRYCAHADFDEALRLDPRLARAYVQRGSLDLDLFDSEARGSARSDFEAALRIEPSAEALVGRGITTYANSDPDGAALDFRRAIQLNPSHAPAYFQLGNTFALSNNYVSAFANYDRAVQLDSSNPDYLVARGGMQIRTGRGYGAMIADYDAALRLHPFHGARYKKIDLYLYRGQLDLALAELNAAIALAPNDFLYLGKRAELHQRLGRHAMAIRDFDTRLRTADSPDEVVHYANDACRARAIAGVDLKVAFDLCGRAIAAFGQMDPDFAKIMLENGRSSARDSRGLVLLKLGRFAEAFADYNAAYDENPASASHLFGRGVAQTRLGRTAAGQADIATASRLEPSIRDTFAGYGVSP